jgi:sugar lactone lactonase YvrE
VTKATAPPLSFDFLTDGTLLIVAAGETRLLRLDADDNLVTHTDLSHLGRGWNEIVVDGRGSTYINGGGDNPTTGNIDLITAGGETRRVATQTAFPNGMAISPDNRTLILAESHGRCLTAFDIDETGDLSNRRIWADLGDGAPDGICIDAQSAVWYADVPNRRCVRVSEGGKVLEQLDIDRGAFACMLGGPDRKTLYITTAQWFGMDSMDKMVGTGHILSVEVSVAGVGWPF